MSEEKAPLHFIEHIIEEDLANGFDQNKIRFRFPPEPNGYLHVGHLKAIALNFNLGQLNQSRLLHQKQECFLPLHSPSNVFHLREV